MIDHTCPRITLSSLCFLGVVLCLRSWAFPSPLHAFLFPSVILPQAIFSSVQRSQFQSWSGFFRCFLSNSYLAFLFRRLLYSEWIFLCYGKDPPVKHHYYLQWSSAFPVDKYMFISECVCIYVNLIIIYYPVLKILSCL